MKRSPLWVMSNRLPLVVRRNGETGSLEAEPGSGGLQSAMEPIIRRLGGTWIGYSGLVEEDGHGVAEVLLGKGGHNYNYREVPLSQREVTGFYRRYSNGKLWPLLHSLPKRVDPLAHESWTEYRSANVKFAKAAMNAPSGATLWVHDYHLLLVPKLIKHKRPDLKVGIFLHIPFPESKVFWSASNAVELVEGMLGADVVGFQVPWYQEHFLDSVAHLEGVVVSEDGSRVEYQGHTCQVGVFPIGIDPDRYDSTGQAAQAKVLRHEWAVPNVLLGLDRLDYTKAVPVRMKGFERLLERRPDLRRKITLVQVSIPSREDVNAYQQERTEVERLVHKINGTYGDGGWRPVWYEYRPLTISSLLSYYRAADIGVVTPVRDGMNLVAKEMVMAGWDSASLVLSNGAGAAWQLGQQGAVLADCNPESICNGLEEALLHSGEERRRRHTLLKRSVVDENVFAWAESFLAALDRS